MPGLLAIVPSATLLGLDGRFIRVEVDVAPPSPEREWDVFLTNASADKATASELAAELRALDIRPGLEPSTPK